MVHSRDVSFVDHLELPFGGRAFSHAVALGDVTGDGDNELVTASTEGTYNATRATRTVGDLFYIPAVSRMYTHALFQRAIICCVELERLPAP